MWYNRCLENRCGWVSKEMGEKLEIEACPVCGEGEVRGTDGIDPKGLHPFLSRSTPKAKKKNQVQNSGEVAAHWMKAEPPRSMQKESITGALNFLHR